MNKSMGTPENFLNIQDEMGESPVWEPTEKALYWIDIAGERIHRYDSGTKKCETFKAGMPVTAIARRASGGWLTITKAGLAFWDSGTNSFSPVTDPFKDNPDFFFNDGAVDRQGRILLGSYNAKDLEAAEGSLYLMDGDGKLYEIDTGLKVPNGIGLSPDGKKLYVTEMFNYKILVYDYDTGKGTVSNRATFCDIPESAGMPDGLTVDSQGFVWSAHWNGSRVTRYDPSGKIDMEIPVPAEIVTCIGFGGEDMDELFITTAWYGLDEKNREKQPQAGDLFRVKTGVKGLVEPEFLG
jgi:sugar lactone lactonase YvrE